MTIRKLKELEKKYSVKELHIQIENLWEEFDAGKIKASKVIDKAYELQKELIGKLEEHVYYLEIALKKEIARVKYLRQEILEYDDEDK